ncbi:MAG: METTL5 family protein [Thermoplasmata archaeon]
MRKKHLEILLSKVEDIEAPNVHLEQYSTPPSIAAAILHLANSLGDVEGKRIIELGCGNGIFALGAALLGAGECIGIDIDPKAIEKAKENANKLSLNVEFICLDVNEVTGNYDTVFQNPPFGCQQKHADLPFLGKAVEIGNVIYSLHRGETERFIEYQFVSKGCRITHKERFKFPVKHRYKFHRASEVKFDVVMFRAERG